MAYSANTNTITHERINRCVKFLLPAAAVPDLLPVVDFLEDWGQGCSLPLAQNCDGVQRSKVPLHCSMDPEGKKPPREQGEKGLLVDGPPSGH